MGCIHDMSVSQHHQPLGCHHGNLPDATLQCAVTFAHRGKLHNAVALGVKACGLEIKGDQRAHKL